MTRLLFTTLFVAACGGATDSPPPAEAPETDEPVAAKEPGLVTDAPKCAPKAPAKANSLLLAQAWLTKEGGKITPQPAKLAIWTKGDEGWTSSELLDPDSNVFHKAMAYDGGILTIGAMGAKLKHWKRDGDAWAGTTLWEKSWGGKFDRLRDVELGDVDGDGKDDIVIATHDQGVVAVGKINDDGTVGFQEMDQKADTFVHEIEIGDIDGDGKNEFYATPSGRNSSSMESQEGGVRRYDLQDIDGTYVGTQVAHWDISHAKEILVADVDGDCTDELYAVREAHTRKDDKGKVQILDPVTIYRVKPDGKGGYSNDPVATIDDKQLRFLVPGDVDGDGRMELVAASWKAGLFLLELNTEGTFNRTLIDADSAGFEHATHVADIDGDGKVEIYVGADNQGAFNQYTWNGKDFTKVNIGAIGERHFTWNIQDAEL